MRRFAALAIVVLASAPAIARVIYVRGSAAGANDGSSWENAFVDLHDALGVATAGDEIWVASGFYFPDRGTGDPSLRYDVPADVSLYGGFSGVETTLDERDWLVHAATLSADIDGDGTLAGDAPQIIIVSDGGAETRLDGFHFVGGASDGEADRASIELYAGRMLLTNCWWHYGGFAQHGGETVISDVYTRGARSYFVAGSARLQRATMVGSDIVVRADASLVMHQCEQYGFGSCYNDEGELYVANSLFAGDGGSGGHSSTFTAVSNYRGNLSVVGSKFIGNRDLGSGGMHCVFHSGTEEDSVDVVLNTFAGNRSYDGYSAFCCGGFGTELVIGNVDADNENIVQSNSFHIALFPCRVEGVENFLRPPSPGADGRWLTIDDDYGDTRLLETSELIDVGLIADFLRPTDIHDLDEDGDITELLPLDADRQPRLTGEDVDCGASEYPPCLQYVAEPADAIVCRGGVAVLSAGVTGSSDLKLQWRRDFLPLVDDGRVLGSRTATLEILDVTDDDSTHRYELVAEDACGRVISRPASIRMSPGPIILQQPVEVRACYGDSATFSVDAIGGGALRYQWRHDGGDLADDEIYSGTTTNTLQIASYDAPQYGEYSVLITDDCFETLSDEVLLRHVHPVVVTSPADATTCEGSSATFEVVADGCDLSYRWVKGTKTLVDDGRIQGSATAQLTIHDVTSADAAAYFVAVEAPDGSQTFPRADLFVEPPPVFLENPESQTRTAGDVVVLQAEIDAPVGVYTYSWRRNGVPLSDGGSVFGSQTPALVLLPFQSSHVGEYECVASSVFDQCFATSASAVLTLAGCPSPALHCNYSDIAPRGAVDCRVNLADLGQALAAYAPGVGGKSRDDGDVFPPAVGDGIVDLSDISHRLRCGLPVAALVVRPFIAPCTPEHSPTGGARQPPVGRAAGLVDHRAAEIGFERVAGVDARRDAERRRRTVLVPAVVVVTPAVRIAAPAVGVLVAGVVPRLFEGAGTLAIRAAESGERTEGDGGGETAKGGQTDHVTSPRSSCVPQGTLFSAFPQAVGCGLPTVATPFAASTTYVTRRPRDFTGATVRVTTEARIATRRAGATGAARGSPALQAPAARGARE